MPTVELEECFRVVARSDEQVNRRRARILGAIIGLGAAILVLVRPSFGDAAGFYVAEVIGAAGLAMLVSGLLRPVSTTLEVTPTEISWWHGRGKRRVLSRANIRCIDFDQGEDRDMSIVYFRDSAWWDQLPDGLLRRDGSHLLLAAWLRRHWSNVEIRGGSQSPPNYVSG